MKILVSIKRTPHRDAKIRVGSDGQLQLQDVKFEVNPFDELAVEEALRIKDASQAEVVVVTVGGDECREALLAALAMGADRAVRIDTDAELDHLQLAKALVGVIGREAPDLVLAGKLAVDDESGQVPLMVAALLDWPQASQASQVEVSSDGKSARVTCEIDVGVEHVELNLPAVITADLRLNEPRFASLPGIMKAKKKPFDVVPVTVAGDVGPCRTEIVGFSEPPAKEAGVIVESVEELVSALAERKLI